MLKELSISVQVFYPKFDRQSLIHELEKRLGDLAQRLPLALVVLFGSYALGNYTVASDIDLLVVYEGEQREDAFATVKKTLDLPRLEPHVYTEAEYKLVKNSIRRMTAGGVVLFSKRKNFEESRVQPPLDY